MTLDRLKNLYHLQSEIDILQQRIDALKGEAEAITQKLSDMPNGHSDDKLGKIIAEYIDLENEMLTIREQQISEQKDITRFINSIADTQTRNIFYLRFFEHLTWEQVALRLGGINSAENCRKIVYRYLKNHF